MPSAKHDPISAEQREALREAFNIAFGRAAATLARLVHRRILLSPPRLHIVPAAQARQVINQEWRTRQGVAVYQTFVGGLEGTASFLLSVEASRQLLALLLDDPPGVPLNASDVDALVEVGNIIFGALVAVLSDLLRDPLVLSPPEGRVLAFERWWRSPPWGQSARMRLVIVHSRFEVAETIVDFLLVVATQMAALQRLTEAMERLVS